MTGDPYWDEGVKGFTRLVVPPTVPALDLVYVREKVLRVVNDDFDDGVITALIAAGTRAAEHATHRAIKPQTLAQVMGGFPEGPEIELRRGPVSAIEKIEYVAADGVLVEWNPTAYALVLGGMYERARVRAVAGWPVTSTAHARDAVTITYRAGYLTDTDPELGLILRGIEKFICENYDVRGLSIPGTSIAPAAYGLEYFWRPMR